MNYFNLNICKVLDLPDTIDNELNFIEAKVGLGSKEFNVLYSPLIGELIVGKQTITEAIGIFKPIEKYKSFEFENLFGFKRGCEDFRDNKMVIVFRN